MLNLNYLMDQVIRRRVLSQTFDPKSIKLRGCFKNEITKDKKGEYVSHLEITEAVLVRSNTVNNEY